MLQIIVLHLAQLNCISKRDIKLTEIDGSDFTISSLFRLHLKQICLISMKLVGEAAQRVEMALIISSKCLLSLHLRFIII